MDLKLYIEYTITQTGKQLNCDQAIKLEKYENRVTKIIFNVEEWLSSDARLYLALLNPETKKYHYEPLLFDGTNYYLIIGTQISYYPGKHKCILIGVTPAVELDDNITYDLTNAIYVSREFNRLTVLDNFIDDVAVELSKPNLDYMLDNYVVLHNNISVLADQIAEYETTCTEDLAACSQILEQCNEILEQCQEILEEVRNTQTNINSQASNLSSMYSNYLAGMQRVYNEYIESIRNGGEP